MGTPWYRPTRVNLAVSGGEYGWRNGTGKWPEYYPDSLGAVVNTGMGSPTGVTFGTVAKFPAKYQHAFFAADWSYGKIYAVHMTPDGAGYRGTFEKFVEGKPFGVTDVVINPADGKMYITIGGRGSQSGLYRVSYVGTEPTSPAKPQADKGAAEARAIRHKLEQFHGKQDPGAVDFAWAYLDSPDRYLRYAARVAIEWQDLKSWKQRALDQRSPTASIQALIALIRAGSISDGQRPDKTMAFKPNPDLQREVLDALAKLPASSLSEEQSLESLRALGLSFIRLGPPDDDCRNNAVAVLDPIYPSQSRLLNRELGQLLAYLQAPNVVAKSMKLLTAADTQEEQLQHALILRGVKVGWTPELRQQYFSAAQSRPGEVHRREQLQELPRPHPRRCHRHAERRREDRACAIPEGNAERGSRAGGDAATVHPQLADVRPDRPLSPRRRKAAISRKAGRRSRRHNV